MEGYSTCEASLESEGVCIGYFRGCRNEGEAQVKKIQSLLSESKGRKVDCEG